MVVRDLPPSSVAVSRISTMAVPLLPKQKTRVRFSYPAHCYSRRTGKVEAQVRPARQSFSDGGFRSPALFKNF